MTARDRAQIGLMLVAIAVTAAYALLSAHVWLLVRRGKAPRKVELVAMRLVEVFYFNMLGLPALGVLLAPLTCDATGHITGAVGHNVFLPEKQCSSLTLLGLVGLAVAFLLHIPLYLTVCVKDCELDPLTRVPFAAGSMTAVARMEPLKVLSLVSFIGGRTRSRAPALVTL